MRARKLAAKLGQPIPSWAGAKQAPKRGAIVPHVPDELRDWMRRTPGSVVRVTTTVVELHALGQPTQRFQSIDAAISAVRT